VPFDLFRRRGAPRSVPEATSLPDGIPFVGFTDEWRIEGVMEIEGRAWDALNRRAPIPIAGVRWGPVDGSEPLEPAPGLRSIDPYDLVVALAVPAESGSRNELVRGAVVPLDVVLHCPPLRVVGTVRVRPGDDADALLAHHPELFIPVGGAVAFLDRQPLPIPANDLVLVNRAYLKEAREIDARTMEAVRPLARAADEGAG
jgi:hypothetical protein